MTYTPRDAERYGHMLKFFSGCESLEELKESAMRLYFPDLSYSRADLMMALKQTAMEKGWKL
jgi:hypothetical protein